MASKIKILDELVANQIAAGEVIERPASVVKELVENSIDAGSTRIQVEVEDGGRKSIRVLDNGEGIMKEDVFTAFERHATSKISEATDLFSIRTLGFRGEALPSIAAISRVTLKTRTADESLGTVVRIEGGEVTKQYEQGMAVGTDFLVEDIFFNTPARYKYLKTTSTELGQISDIFNRIALAKPHIAMTLMHNGKIVSKTPGTGRLKDTILTIFGRELVDNLIDVDHEESYIKVSGFISTPTAYRSSKKHQTFFVNGRYVRSSLLSRGVDGGFSNLLPPNRYPIVFLFIHINPIHVDVNVHPAKFEVKFSRPEIVIEAVGKGIRKSLIEGRYLPSFTPLKKNLKDRSNSRKQEKSLFNMNHIEEFEQSLPNNNHGDTGTEASVGASRKADANADASTSVDVSKDLSDKKGPFESEKGSKNSFVGAEGQGMDPYIQEISSFGGVAERLKKMNHLLSNADERNWDPIKGREYEDKKTPERKTKNISRNDLLKRPENLNNPEQPNYNQGSNLEKNSKEDEANVFLTQPESKDKGNFSVPDSYAEKKGVNKASLIAELLPIGQIHRTYIIAEGRDGFYVIDQHVAHERILYEELMATFRTKGLPSQTLLIPLTLELTLKEIQIIQENLDLFDKLGFEVEHFGGNTVIIRSAPRRLDERPDKTLFLEIVDLILEEKKAGDLAQLYKKLITTLSCKGAIKAGDYLDQGEMIRLLQELGKTENPLFCPHGRPILFHISEHDLLKAFHRI